MSETPNLLMEERVGRLLTEQKLSIAVAESCTGGLVTHHLTNVPGSSVFLIGSVVAYAYEAKVSMLGVTWETLNQFGAVSQETALAMAHGARTRLGADLGLAITGIAGPSGGMPGKPVGLTYLALVASDSKAVQRHVWNGNRLENKEQTAQAALKMVLEYLESRSNLRRPLSGGQTH